MEQAVETTPDAERTIRWTEMLASDIGPRRPTSRAERTAAEWLRGQLADAGLDAKLERFRAFSTFALPQAVPLLLSLAGRAAGGRQPRLGGALGLSALLLAAAEEDLRLRPLSRALAQWPSQNVVAAVEPRGTAARTLCIVSHIDTSRSGVLFSPALGSRVRGLLAATGVAFGTQAAEPLLRHFRPGRGVAALGAAWLVLMLALLLEREVRGEDVPGANDNASGVAVTAALAAEMSAAPLESTRLVLLVTGAEEAGTLGAEAFLRSRDTADWLFLNFDSVAGAATLRYLPREGLLRTVGADPGLIAVASDLAVRRPELGLEPAERLAGLTYDATPALVRGRRALTISAQDETIPHYHQPSDNAGNIDRDVLARALEVGRELIFAIDGGDAD